MIKDKSRNNIDCKNCPFTICNLLRKEFIYCLFEDCDKLAKELLHLKYKGE